ncbi:MAG TPA: biopolymer transporter ExbD [Candidatus Polarisedimenticolia bacterium]|nr:biopolymer transporter ExbD [Candidatus Polarisedimenticolia bacterium]
MGMQLGGTGVKSDINVTPFVDIVLVLLIIFMVVTPLLSRALDISVPPKSDVSVAEASSADQLILTVKGPAGNEKIFLNQEEIAGGVTSVKDRIEELMKGRHDKVVFFQADNELPYQDVVKVMDEIRGGGAEKIGLITDESLNVAPAGGGQ